MNTPDEKIQRVIDYLKKIRTICEEATEIPPDLGVIEMLADNALRELDAGKAGRGSE